MLHLAQSALATLPVAAPWLITCDWPIPAVDRSGRQAYAVRMCCA